MSTLDNPGSLGRADAAPGRQICRHGHEPVFASNWRPTRPAALEPPAYRYDVAVNVDATLIVRAADRQPEAVLQSDEQRAWDMPDRATGATLDLLTS